MSQFSNSENHSADFEMAESIRLEYLRAMDIDCWVLKSELESAMNNQEAQLEDANPEPVQQSQVVVKDGPDNFGAIGPVKDIVQTEELQKQSELQETTAVDVSPSKLPDPTELSYTSASPTQSNKISFETGIKPNRFLKLVSWTNQNIGEQHSKSILIVCRHEIDQPANSFARQNSPSQFMLDYINALIGLVQPLPVELKIQLAHLSEAGLSNDSIPMDKVLVDCKPDLILLLGDETVAHLFGAQVDVASVRGRLLELEQDLKALASYHPYSMIKNPGLKSLAQQDLLNLASYLLHSDRA